MNLTMTLRHVTLAGSLAWALCLTLERGVARVGMLRSYLMTPARGGGWAGRGVESDVPGVKAVCQRVLLWLLHLMILGCRLSLYGHSWLLPCLGLGW